DERTRRLSWSDPRWVAGGDETGAERPGTMPERLPRRKWDVLRGAMAGRIAPPHHRSDRDQILQQVAGDDDPLDFGRSLTDFADLGVAHHAFHRIFLRISVATVDLDGFRGRTHRHFRAEELCHRRFLRERVPVLREPRRMIDEVTPRLELRCDVGKLELDALELRDRLAELLARGRVLQREIEGALRETERKRRDADAPGVERAHEVDEPRSFVAQPVLRRHLDILEQKLPRVGRPPAKLVFLPSARETLHLAEFR